MASAATALATAVIASATLIAAVGTRRWRLLYSVGRRRGAMAVDICEAPHDALAEGPVPAGVILFYPPRAIPPKALRYRMFDGRDAGVDIRRSSRACRLGHEMETSGDRGVTSHAKHLRVPGGGSRFQRDPPSLTVDLAAAPIIQALGAARPRACVVWPCAAAEPRSAPHARYGSPRWSPSCAHRPTPRSTWRAVGMRAAAGAVPAAGGPAAA